jgi:predicted anti-sigma-YlaC factor YlaD
MAERCPSGFDRSLLSGHLDGELTQAAEQRVRIHLEDCAACRASYRELAELREATMSTQLDHPTDDQWREAPRTAASATSRGLGWILLIAWCVLTGGYGLWQAWQEVGNPFERLLVFGGLAALVLLFLSVVLDRLHARRTDPYEEVER